MCVKSGDKGRELCVVYIFLGMDIVSWVIFKWMGWCGRWEV